MFKSRFRHQQGLQHEFLIVTAKDSISKSCGLENVCPIADKQSPGSTGKVKWSSTNNNGHPGFSENPIEENFHIVVMFQRQNTYGAHIFTHVPLFVPSNRLSC
jgi:hypothetical protein